MAIGAGALGQFAIGQAQTQPVYVLPSLFVNTSTFYSPTVIPDQALIQATTLTNSQTFYSATITNVYYLRPPLLTNTSYFFERGGLWAERQEQSETWIERTQQSETWTRAA